MINHGLQHMSLSIVNSLEENAWREFVYHHPQGNIFHTPEMFEVFKRTKGYSPQLWASLGAQGEVLAVLPLVNITLHSGLLRRLTTRAIAYGGALSSPGAAGREGVDALLRTYFERAVNQVLFTQLRHQSDAGDIRPILEQNGFQYEDHLNYLIDIGCSPEQLLLNIGSRTRKHIRKGLRRGKVTVEILTQREQIEDWYNLVRLTYNLARIPLADRSLFEATFDVLQPQGMVKFWLAKVGDFNAAASVELIYKDTIYGWYGGVDRAYASEVPGELLMWHILKWGAENGYHVYDFGGAGKPNEKYGVRDFKAKFGGNLVCYGRDTFVPNRILLNISTSVYKIYQKFLDRRVNRFARIIAKYSGKSILNTVNW